MICEFDTKILTNHYHHSGDETPEWLGRSGNGLLELEVAVVSVVDQEVPIRFAIDGTHPSASGDLLKDARRFREGWHGKFACIHAELFEAVVVLLYVDLIRSTFEELDIELHEPAEASSLGGRGVVGENEDFTSVSLRHGGDSGVHIRPLR